MYWKQIGITNDNILSYHDIFHNIVSWLKNQYRPPLWTGYDSRSKEFDMGYTTFGSTV